MKIQAQDAANSFKYYECNSLESSDLYDIFKRQQIFFSILKRQDTSAENKLSISNLIDKHGFPPNDSCSIASWQLAREQYSSCGIYFLESLNISILKKIILALLPLLYIYLF